MAFSKNIQAKSIGLWVFKVILALAFITFGSFKLMGAPMMVQEFDTIGLGHGFRFVTGLSEVGAAVLLLIPRTWRFGALIVLGVSIGAFIAQATRLHGDVIHTIVLIALTGVMAWLAWRPGSGANLAA